MKNSQRNLHKFVDLIKESIRLRIKSKLLLEKKVIINPNAPVLLQMDKYLEQFPPLKRVITDLLSDKYRLYVKDVVNLAPKPTIFRVMLKNGMDFELIYDGDDNFSAKVAGKHYNLAISGELVKATRKIATQLTLDGPLVPEQMSAGAPTTDGGGGGGMGSTPASTGVFEPKSDPSAAPDQNKPSERDPFGGGNVAPDFTGEPDK